MNLILEKAIITDAVELLKMQTQAFTPLLEKYQDYHTSPANETIDRVTERITNPEGAFYKILLEGLMVGAICVTSKKEYMWISPMFILPEFQGQGIAQKAIKLAEEKHPDFKRWELATIQEEERNCYLYEKMGYVKMGIAKEINERATLIYYQKEIN
ncbi:GNAT family N-acetyltransferase [Ornithinibacillus xuwenensis]|uniref:GNAT family N-acetyltransferase n=1 Tax=Ornithinibacillus xuwenensis TaxID=3144668 RepID=A0ABU9XGP1_9BACI